MIRDENKCGKNVYGAHYNNKERPVIVSMHPNLGGLELHTPRGKRLRTSAKNFPAIHRKTPLAWRTGTTHTHKPSKRKRTTHPLK